MKRSLVLTGCAVFLFYLVIGSQAFAASELARVKVEWGAPPSGAGSDVVKYHVWIQFWNPNIHKSGFWGEIDTTTDTSYVLECYRGMNYMARVYAEDAEGNMGIASPESDPLLIPGAELLGASSKINPTPPGKPKI